MKINQKSFIQISLLMLIIGSLFFVVQPTQAGFFDWLSWNKVKTIFIKEQIRESLPASISESIKETPLPEEIIPKTSALEIQETLEEILPVANSEATAPEKVIYRDNPEQGVVIQNLKNQITGLQNQIKNLEKQIDDLLSKFPEIKVITKEIPVEKVVIKEVIKEVPVEVVKEVIRVKEVPVEKIVTKEVLVPQTCPVCQACQQCSSLGEVKTIDISRMKIITEPSSTAVSIRITGTYIQGETLPRFLALATLFYWEADKPTEVKEGSIPIEYAGNDTYQYIRSKGAYGISNLYPETTYNYYVEFRGAGLEYEGITAKTGVESFTTLEPRIIIVPSSYNAVYDSALNLWKLPVDLSAINEFSSPIALKSFIFEFESSAFDYSDAFMIPQKIELRKREGYNLLTEQIITDLTSVYGNTGYGGYPKTFSFSTTQMTYPAYLEPDPRGVLYYKLVFYFNVDFGSRANRISGNLVLNSFTAEINGMVKNFTSSNDFRFSFMVNK